MAFLSPEAIVRELPIVKGDYILDIGSGHGAYAFEIAKVSSGAKVLAIDIDVRALDAIANNAITLGYHNIDTLETDIEQTWPLESYSADGALLINVLHTVTNRSKVLNEIHRVMKPHSYLIVIEWNGDTVFGPGIYAIDKGSMLSLLTSHGYKVVSELPAGSHHYGLLLETL